MSPISDFSKICGKFWVSVKVLLWPYAKWTVVWGQYQLCNNTRFLKNLQVGMLI